jgi:hypothetical protein
MGVFNSDKYFNRNDAEFQRMTGLKKYQFERLLHLLQEYVNDNWSTRGYHNSQFTLADKLLITLRYLRDYPTFLSLGSEFGISESYTYKLFTKISASLVKILKLPNLKELEDSNIQTIIIDVTEQETERPKKNNNSNTLVNKNVIQIKH